MVAQRAGTESSAESDGDLAQKVTLQWRLPPYPILNRMTHKQNVGICSREYATSSQTRRHIHGSVKKPLWAKPVLRNNSNEPGFLAMDEQGCCQSLVVVQASALPCPGQA